MSEVVSNKDAAQILGIDKLNSLTQRRKRMIEAGTLIEPDHTFKDAGANGAILWTEAGLKIVASELESDAAISYLQQFEEAPPNASMAATPATIAALALDPAEVFKPDVLAKLDGIADATLATIAPKLQQQYVQRQVSQGLPDAIATVSPDLGKALGQWVSQSMGLNLLEEINSAVAPYLSQPAEAEEVSR